MKYLSIDLGLKRIGLAYSAYANVITPLKAIERKNRNQAALEVKKVIVEWQIDTIVMGIPLGGSSEDEMRRRSSHFLSLLEFGGDIFYQDESSTSLEASELLEGKMRHIRDGRIDSIAAMIILERFLSAK